MNIYIFIPFKKSVNFFEIFYLPFRLFLLINNIFIIIKFKEILE